MPKPKKKTLEQEAAESYDGKDDSEEGSYD